MCEKVQGGVTYLETQPTGVKGKAEWGPRMTPAKIEHRTPPDEGLSPDEIAMAEVARKPLAVQQAFLINKQPPLFIPFQLLNTPSVKGVI